MSGLFPFLRRVGLLRSLLWLVTVVVIACAPFADGRVETGWMLGPTVIAPTLMAMLAFSLPLDMTMTRVFMLDRPEPEQRQMRRVFWLEAMLLAVMLASYTPFLMRLLGK